MMNRRDFLAGSGLFLTGFVLAQGEQPEEGMVPIAGIPPNARWGYLIDPAACIGCGACMRACRAENKVPETHWRTWVERYLYVEKDGKIDVEIDSPKGGEKGYPPAGDKKVQKGFFVPKICNHCATPSCVRVCPATATYISPEGVVLVDDKWCIGCGYCVQACPYGMRYINEEQGVAAKCTWCYHRITKGRKPACVMACPTGARRFGNLRDPDDPVTKVFREERVYVVRPETGNDPQVRYTNLGREVI